MKQLALYFVFFWSSIITLSCSKNYENPIFSETSDSRTKILMDSLNTIFLSSPVGWRAVVYADSAHYKSNNPIKLPFAVRLDQSGTITARKAFESWSDTAYYRLKMAMEPEFIFSNIGQGDLLSNLRYYEYRIRHYSRDSIGLLGRLGESIIKLYPLKDDNDLLQEILKENWISITTGNISLETTHNSSSVEFKSMKQFKLLYPNTTLSTLDMSDAELASLAPLLGQGFRFVLKPTGSKNKIESIESVDVTASPSSYFDLKSKQCEYSFDPSTNTLKIKATLVYVPSEDSPYALLGKATFTIDQTIRLIPSIG
ncbi:hypothetical protein BWD42_07760 [Sphingobacterium sp. CZ-UAM]|uniref:DUF4302 domain-containing protein n=1 Tax=Sphingobacterium sp. CZ-UAM TaxID=1933868 RepID=UPI00098620B0|nr:DUF4302 domain-containing protein [Sphingobacterium sp. CZ-UAM]OOG19785.1 hypothetical protein BWD42_07760 [Sphingobacterium sp. CZ-UAM]